MTNDRHRAPPAAARVIDMAPLQRLLRMAGPSHAPAIITAFLDDLETTRTGLDVAWNGPDCAALQMQSHVLVALAGTIGDTDLQAQAQHLNAVARDQVTADIDALKTDTMRGLAELIATLATLATPAPLARPEP